MRPYLENRVNRGRLQISGAPRGAFPEHLHTDVEMVYVFEGQMTMMVDGAPRHLDPGDLCICFPGIAHGYVERKDARVVMLIFPPEISPDFPALLSKSQPKDPVLRKGDLPADIPFCMEQLKIESAEMGDERVLRGYIQVILSRALPQLTLTDRDPDMANVVYEIMKYLSIHCVEPVSLDDLSRALGVSKSYLSHTFSQRIGMNFRTYVNTLRADRACLLLRNSTRTITDIAYECGFETQRTFNRVFAAQYGVSPSDYRKKYQKENGGENPSPAGMKGELK